MSDRFERYGAIAGYLALVGFIALMLFRPPLGKPVATWVQDQYDKTLVQTQIADANKKLADIDARLTAALSKPDSPEKTAELQKIQADAAKLKAGK